ncbi:MAG: DinB family protein [Phycisphaerales bacterium]|nr:DinB family protein [Phycisphaerales bacterium]
MTTTAGHTLEAIIPAANLMVGYAKLLTDDIPADRFCELPHPTMNHPAFCIGHLSIYPDRMLDMIGRSELRREQKGFSELFAAGVACAPDTGQYPDKKTICDYYHDRHTTLIAALEGIDESVLAQQNPVEGRFRDMAPTIGAAVVFLLTAHAGVHLGQLSAWRRAANLPSVM